MEKIGADTKSEIYHGNEVCNDKGETYILKSHPSISTNEYRCAARNIDIIFTHEDIKELVSKKEPNEQKNDEIRRLKKQIKHCKNPLERKQLEKKLNKAYKEKKNGKRKDNRTDDNT